MNKLYLVWVSIGAPRQRTWRTQRKVFATGQTQRAAERRAAEFALTLYPPQTTSKRVARADQSIPFCNTPDDVLRDFYA